MTVDALNRYEDSIPFRMRFPLIMLELAIRSHSLYRRPEGLTDEEQMYCQLLKDADKIDIFRVNCDTPPEEIYNVTTRELRHSLVSDA